MADYVGGIPFREFDEAVAAGRRDFIIEDYLQDIAEAILFEESPFIARLVDVGDFKTLAPEWETKRDWPRELWAKVTDSGGGNYVVQFRSTDNWNGGTLDVDHLAQVVGPLTPIIKNVNGWPEQVHIKSTETVDALSALEVESTTGGTVTVDADYVLYTLGAKPWSPKDGFQQPVALEREKEHTFGQMFREHIEINVVDEALEERTVKNPWQEKIDDATRLLAQRKAQAFWTQEPRYSAGQTVTPYAEAHFKMAGILWWITKAQADQENLNIYVNAAGARPDPLVIQDILFHLQVDELANPKTCGYELWGNPDTMRHVHLWEREFARTQKADRGVGFFKTDLGYGTTVAGEFKEGRVGFYSDRRIPKGMIVVVPVKRIKHGHLRKCNLQAFNPSPNFLGKQRILWEVVMGTAPVNPREIGIYFNLADYGV